jgi:recombination protein RecR
MRRFPESISNLVAAFSRLPGVGPKTALRYVFYMLKQPKADLEVMARSLTKLGEKIKICPECFTYTERETCDICLDLKRATNVICVVEESRDIATIESTNMFPGKYHVLGGTLNPIEGMTPEFLRIKELQNKIENSDDIEEVILALSPTVEGEASIMYLTKILSPLNVTITRLARGLPVGATLEFADEVTLGAALKRRSKTKPQI